MKRFDGQIVKALREYVAREEARVMREMPLNPNFVEEIFTRIDAVEVQEPNAVIKSGVARPEETPRPERRLPVSSIFSLEQMLNWRAALAIAVVLVLTGGVYLLVPSGIELRALSVPKLGGAASLPRNLRIKIHQDKIGLDLYEGGDRMRGTLGHVPTNVPPGVSLFAGELRGLEGDARLVRLHGYLWVTNVPGRSTLKRAVDIKNAVLEATLEMPNLVPVPVKMEFVPNP